LMAIPGVADLHARSFEAHKTIFKQMMTDPNEGQLYWQLVLSGSSQPPTNEMARNQINRINQVRRG
ncbi:MAG: glycosyltransferase family 2 protein, partial [Paracoccaceae bacterium]